MKSFASCLGTDSWLTAEISLDDATAEPTAVRASLANLTGFASDVETIARNTDHFCDALLDERIERQLWERNRLEPRLYFASYERHDEPTPVLFAFYRTSRNTLRGTAFFLREEFPETDFESFRQLFDSVARSEEHVELPSDW